MDRASANQGTQGVPLHRGGQHQPKAQVTHMANPVQAMAMPEPVSPPELMLIMPMASAMGPGHCVHFRVTRCRAVARVKDCWRNAHPATAMGTNTHALIFGAFTTSVHRHSMEAKLPVLHQERLEAIHSGVTAPTTQSKASPGLGGRQANRTTARTGHHAANSGATMGAEPAAKPDQKCNSGRGSPICKRRPWPTDSQMRAIPHHHEAGVVHNMGVATRTHAQLGSRLGRVRMPLVRWAVWIQRADITTAKPAPHGAWSISDAPWTPKPPNTNSTAAVRGTMPQATG